MEASKEYVCFFNSHRAWGGGEKWHSMVATYLSSKNYNVCVCASKYGELRKKFTNTNVICHSVNFSNLSFLNPFAYINVWRILRKYPIKTIILCLPIDIKIAGVVAHFLKIPNIIYRRGSAIPIKNSCYNRFLFSKIITDVIANSEATKNTILELNQNLFPSNKIKVLYNGVKIPYQINKKNRLQNSKFIIGTAGRLEPQKNLFSLINIAKILCERNVDFEIRIAGTGSLYDDLISVIFKEHLDERVKLYGFQRDMSQFYSQLDVFVLASHWEGFGFVLAEAMCYKLPLIAYNVSSNPELIQDKYNGYLIPKGCEHKFADKLQFLMENEEIYNKMCQASFAFVKEFFDMDKNINLVEDYLNTLS